MIGLALLAVLAPATAQSEMLGVNVPDDFAVGYQARNALLDMKEVVHPPETVENWTKLITLQLMFGAARRQSADAFYRGWQQDMRQACAGLTDTLVKGHVDGRPALRGTLSCPRNPQTGKPENLVAVLVQGEANLMMVQVAFRHPIGAADTALIDRIVGSLKVCDQRALAACSARKAGGFVATSKR